MIIGIDIDNTLTDIEEELNEAAFKYAKELGKKVDFSEDIGEDSKNNGNIYKEKFNFTYNELKYFLKDIQEEIINKAKPRSYTVEIIKDLRKKGNKIYIITARDSEFHNDPYMLSKNWLDKNDIEYDKLIVNAREKAPICKKEKVDLFIDDSLNNCIDVSNEGIRVIRISNSKEKHGNIITLSNWQDIAKYIENEVLN